MGEVTFECSLRHHVIVSMEPLAAYQIVRFTEDFTANDVEVLAWERAHWDEGEGEREI